ncbi:hypothetical protein QUF44_01430 [Bacillus subtilis]|nr:hypothetical protein [Bacillus subtilis]MDM5300296.1 hypothetical protein [Bacillus subtilis]MDM5322349.1 hypothetical protein [Bacillus subtilis]
MIAKAYGLSEREKDIAYRIIRGLATKDTLTTFIFRLMPSQTI